jgi:hypothetical protein
MPPKNVCDANDLRNNKVPSSKEEGATDDTTTKAAPHRRRTKTRREQYPPGLFTNANGNLRVVAVTVRHPCKFFFAILLVTLLLVLALFRGFASSESGNPFSDPGGQYETNDVRSLAYDSLKLAVEEVKEIREDDSPTTTTGRLRLLEEQHGEQGKPKAATPTKTTLRDYFVTAGSPLEQLLAKSRTAAAAASSSDKGRKTKSSSTRRRRRRRQLQGGGPGNDGGGGDRRTQEQLLDITYWVYEADNANEKGVFGSADSIRAMRESHDLFLQDTNYDTFCWKEYETVVVVVEGNSTNSTSIETTSKCRPPTSPLNVYYPSRYDSDIAAHVIEQLSDPAQVEKYNAMSLCLEFGLLCDTIPAEYNTTDVLAWASNLNANMTVLSDAWDGTGELVDEQYIDQVTQLIAHLMQLRTKRGFVDFGFDKDFALNNTVSRYSRAIFVWGGPLAQTASAANDALSDEDREDEDEEVLKE